MNKALILIFLNLLICVQFVIAVDLGQKIEAESAALSGTTELVFNTTASGETFVKLLSSAPEGSVQFNVDNIPINGTYKLYAYSFNAGVTQNINLSVNGGTDTIVTLQPSNWAFEGEPRFTLFEVDLLQGSNTISFTALSGVQVLLDCFKVTENFNAYYFSSAGDDDANDGSITSPWQTLTKANEVAIKDGLLLGGDKVFFKSGDTFEGNFEIRCSGTVDLPIEITSYDVGDLPIISGSGNIGGGDYFEAIKLINASNIVLSKIWVKNDRQDSTRYSYGSTKSFGILVAANKWGGVVSNLAFRDLKISDVYGVVMPVEFNSLSVTGIRFESDSSEVGTDVNIQDVLIEGCYFTHIGKAGVWSIHKGKDGGVDSVNRSKNFTIRNNTFYQTGGSGIILSKVNNALVENNDFDHSGYSNVSEPRLVGRGSGMWVFSCRNILAQYNRSLSIRGDGDSYGMHIDFGNKNIIYQYNYSEDSEGGFCEILGDNHNVAYRFNVSVNDGFRDFHGNSIWTSGYVGTGNDPVPSNGVYVYNNTIYLAENLAPDISLFSQNTYIYNNIFKQTGAGVIGENVTIEIQNGGEFIVANNLFEGNISTQFTDYDNSAVFADPSFQTEGALNIEGYKILAGSQAIDAGTAFPEPTFPKAGQGVFKDITLYPIYDLYGNSVDVSNVAPNIGADNSFSIITGALNEDAETGSNIKIWPNPTTGMISIKLGESESDYSYFVFDINGKLKQTGNLSSENNTVSLNKFYSGIYFLHIDSFEPIKVIKY
ncbi:MAG: right-handed parallel beta-helix repeat-containing protein [Flavobacteriales bacterium]|nr:right-handed parallel beta-helix repeat-containing protein [Flavobacteriales bacterium]